MAPWSCCANPFSTDMMAGVQAMIRESAGDEWSYLKGRYHLPPKRLIDDYALDNKQVLGRGMNGDVRLAVSRAHGRAVAVKSFKYPFFSSFTDLSKVKKSLANELEIALQMDHPCMVRLLDVYESPRGIDMVMEYLTGGTLEEEMQLPASEATDAGPTNSRRFAEADAASIACDMLRALCYMHSHGLIHRDLKPGNFAYVNYLGERGMLKLLDFGFSTRHKEGELMRRACGTVPYLAPEVLRRSYDDEKCDIWSVGVIVFRLLIGRFPFGSSRDREDVLNTILEGKYMEQVPKRWSRLSEDARDFLQGLLCVDPKSRLSALHALNHPWIVGRGQRCQVQLSEMTFHGETFVDAVCKYAALQPMKKLCVQLMVWSTVSDERQQARQIFEALDRNRDGVCTVDEFRAMLSEDDKVPSERIEAACNVIGGADEIAYSDIIGALIYFRRIAWNDRMLKYMFGNLAETTSKGKGMYITEESLRKMVGGELNGNPIESVFAEIDKRARGRVSYDDMLEYILDESSDASLSNQRSAI